MATLEKIRNRAGLLVIVVGVALFAFVIGDFLRSGSTFFSQSKQKVIVVDGDAIDIRAFQQRIEEVSNQYRQNGALQDEQLAQLRESVFEEMVGTILLDNEATAVGFTVGDDEKREIIMGDRISPLIQQYFTNPQTGAFDRTQYFNYIGSMEGLDIADVPVGQQAEFLQAKANWENIKKSVIAQRKYSKLNSLLTTAISANTYDSKAYYEEQAESSDFNFVFQSYSSIPDSTIAVSDAEIAALYKERRESFKQTKAQIVDYITVPIAPGENDFAEASILINKAKTELEEAKNIAETVGEYSEQPFIDVYASYEDLDENQRLFVSNAKIGDIEGPTLKQEKYSLYKLLDKKTAPDSVKISMLNLPALDNAESAKLADSLIQVVKSGKTFAEMASAATNGKSSGDIGWQTETSIATGGLDAKSAARIFDAKIGEIFLLNTTVGSHLIQVSEKTKPVEKYKLATISTTVTPSQNTYNTIYNALNQYISQNNKIDLFRSAATDAGYFCRSGMQFTENQPSIYPVRNSRQVIKWAFDHKKGDISEIFECDDYFIVAAVEGSQAEGYIPLEKVKEGLKYELINKKKGEQLLAGLKGKNFDSLEQYAEAMNTTVKEVKFLNFQTVSILGIGVDPSVNVVATTAELNKMTEPFAGRNGVYVLQVTNRSHVAHPFDAAQEGKTVNSQYQQRLSQLLSTNKLLKDHAKIEDNRIRFY